MPAVTRELNKDMNFPENHKYKQDLSSVIDAIVNKVVNMKRFTIYDTSMWFIALKATNCYEKTNANRALFSELIPALVIDITSRRLLKCNDSVCFMMLNLIYRTQSHKEVTRRLKRVHVLFPQPFSRVIYWCHCTQGP